MKDLNQMRVLVDLVINDNGAVDQLPHTRPLANRVPHAWEPAEQIDVIEQSFAKTGSSLVVVPGDMLHDVGQVI